MKEYDVIITGAGAAGLWTAYHLSKQNFKGSVLIMDKGLENRANKNWSFWAEDSEKELITFSEHRWENGYVADKDHDYHFTFGKYCYYSLKEQHFIDKVLEEFADKENFEILECDVLECNENGTVLTSNGHFFAKRNIFNSIYDPSELISKSNSFLWQHFYGRKVRFKEPVFAAKEVAFMDFNIPVNTDCRFLYVLPYTEHEALLEYTIFNSNLLSKAEYVNDWDKIVADKFSGEFEILEEELGRIPMCDYKFSKEKGKLLNIGTAGGMVKASTGFAFRNIYYQTKNLAKSRINTGKPKRIIPHFRYRFFDQLLLKAITDNPDASKVFTSLFEKEEDVPAVLEFLDGKNSLLSDFKIIRKCPKRPFLKAIASTILEIT